MYPVLQAEIEMYKCDETDKRYFTKNHIKAIFLFVFDVTPKSGKRADWLNQLKVR